MKSRIIEEMEEQAELEGFKPGSKPFQDRILGLKVEKCQEMKGNPCQTCPYLDNCSLAHEFWKLLRERQANGKRRDDT